MTGDHNDETPRDESHRRVSRKGGWLTYRSLGPGSGGAAAGAGGEGSLPRHAAAALAPMRRGAALLDPRCGQLSAAAEADLRGTAGRRRGFIEFHHVASGGGDRPQTPRRPTARTPRETEGDRAWNSRRISDAAFRARLAAMGGGSRAVDMGAVLAGGGQPLEGDIGMQDPPHSGPRPRPEDARRRHVYTSSTQRGYQEVDWDAKLPRRFKAPPTALEKSADPVAWGSSAGRHPSGPRPWQSVGAEWDQQQIQPWSAVRKPVSFCSPKSGQIPLYSGFIGSDHKDHIDNGSEHFLPSTLLRTTVPWYTPTARRTTIPGYKAVYATADVPPPTLSLPGITALGPPAFGSKGPLSKMVTAVSPYNPFLTPKDRPSLLI